ncbi:hypothetical protein L3Q82_026141 [Scortum barcoo]|uniref:Uncharacterized protein n=1 Tax=Scortum barcoo TaxID=214431 RepID=A0ACB8WNE6_9TELE|nr:hypothetical protein L3Q82_026141 [Scortum barcoo]
MSGTAPPLTHIKCKPATLLLPTFGAVSVSPNQTNLNFTAAVRDVRVQPSFTEAKDAAAVFPLGLHQSCKFVRLIPQRPHGPHYNLRDRWLVSSPFLPSFGSRPAPRPLLRNSCGTTGVLLHIIADTLGSVGVIISALLMQKYDLMIADPICSMLIALLIGVSVVPLLKESIGILMQRTPLALDHTLPQCYQRVQQLQGVYNLQEPHFWTLCTDIYIGTLKLLIAPDADTRWILSQTHHIFTQAGVRQLYVQIEMAAM